jgi:hypothetical protein
MWWPEKSGDAYLIVVISEATSKARPAMSFSDVAEASWL